MKQFFIIAVFLFLNANVSFAQIEFEDYSSNPVFSYTGVAGTFDQNRIFSQDVVQVDGEFWMYYSGVGNGNSVQIGLAKSPDGINWTRYSSQPIFRCGENLLNSCPANSIWSSFRVEVISVEYEDGAFKMWYRGNNENLNYYGELGYATSGDGINWTAYSGNPIFDASGILGVGYLSVIKVDSVYRLYYIDRVNLKLYFIDSDDGLSWTQDPVFVGDGKFYSVSKIDNVFVAMKDKNMYLSSDGINFDFNDISMTIDNNSPADIARNDLEKVGDEVYSWRTLYEGNVIWSYGNFSINFAKTNLNNFIVSDPNPYPLYTQIESDYPSEIETKEWADDVYGNGEASCGKTIAKCGCAITSLVMMARASGVTTAVDGKDVNPGNMNAWLIDNDGYNSAQSIKWGKALDYFGSKDGDDIITPFKLKTHNEASTTVLKAEAASDNHVIGFSDSVNGGHYFVVSDYILNNFQVRDPWYYNTKTLNDVASSTNKVKDYNNDLDKANIFSYGDAEKLAGFLEITLASPAELRLINEEGKIAGYDVAGNRTEIPTSSYDPFEYIGDPGAVESVTPHYTKRMMVLEADGSYILEVIGTGVGEYNLMISMRDANGKSHELEVSTSTSVGDVDKYTININTGLIEMVSQGDDEEDDEGDDNEVSSRDAFIALVIKATGDKKNVVQEFFVRAANRIFDSIDRDSSRLAHIRLKVFAILLKVKHVDDDELSTAVKELREQLS